MNTTICKSNLKDKLKKNSFRAVVESVLAICHIWLNHMVFNCNSRKKDFYRFLYTRNLRAAMNSTWRNQPTNKNLYGKIAKAIASILP